MSNGIVGEAAGKPNVALTIGILLPACLCYSLAILYDMCKSVFVILEFPND